MMIGNNKDRKWIDNWKLGIGNWKFSASVFPNNISSISVSGAASNLRRRVLIPLFPHHPVCQSFSFFHTGLVKGVDFKKATGKSSLHLKKEEKPPRCKQIYFRDSNCIVHPFAKAFCPKLDIPFRKIL